MRRFVIVAALAAVLALGFADRAGAQVVYGYNSYGYNPYNGNMRYNRTLVTPYSAQQSRGYYNPYSGYGGQQYRYTDAGGTQFGGGYGTTPYGGTYQYGYVQPGYGYGYYGPGYPAPLYRTGYGPVYPGYGPPVYRTGYGPIYPR